MDLDFLGKGNFLFKKGKFIQFMRGCVDIVIKGDF